MIRRTVLGSTASEVGLSGLVDRYSWLSSVFPASPGGAAQTKPIHSCLTARSARSPRLTRFFPPCGAPLRTKQPAQLKLQIRSGN
jgi:hypothetical protein